ncbi:aldose 1-epimerase [Deinococcus peraridilitoris]|uniref:Galactose mutarotase-like enzyme n=1 Tax=Deinococcus peraridilitoris (strain DSM 19664 / LMG 22246 / CIP 109416 / KR-200) TaxID=937777 RepID=L0A2X2_DEIPD|nr:galactose mutarotase [Deinococcus peraridilitoris]AFZ68233.1 galactose mutarotase-like enzyme [Deinococcus peraridilitoris DSM 19664]
MTQQTVHTLSNDVLRLEVAPGIGAGIVNLQVRVDADWQPLLRFTSPETLAKGTSSGLASFTLAPFSNRIPGASFAFEGRTVTLRPTTPEGNAQHGDVRNRPHASVQVTDTRAEYFFDSREVEDFNYPFALTLRTVFELSGDTVTQTLEITNVSGERAPFGFGLHPYFERHVAGAPDVEMSFSAAGYYPVGESLIPQGGMQPVPSELEFGEPRPIGAQQFNTLYGGVTGSAVLRYASTPYTVMIDSDPVFSHLVLFTPPDGSLAVEPVSHATDAFNLHERGVPGVGFTALESGETLRGSVRFQVSF